MTWLVPPLAVVTIWPALFVVPGWALVAVARPRIGSTGRLGLAVVLSVAISAHAVYWLALATGGYDRLTIVLVAAALLAPLPVAAWRGGARRLRDELAAARRALRREAPAFVFAAAAAAFVALVLWSSLWQRMDGGVTAGGSNWSDLGVHLSIAQSLNAGNFPPQVPYFAGAPLVYHWFADFHAALLSRSAGLFAVPAFVVGSALLAGALALLVHGLAQRLLRGQHARRAALLAAVLVVFGGGLGWIRFVGDLAAGYGDPIALATGQTYDNFWFQVVGRDAGGGLVFGEAQWPYFRIPSVMGTGLLVHRATAAGLPMLVGAMLLLVAGLPTRARLAAGWRDRPLLIGLAGVLGAMLAPFHFFFFPAWLLLALLWVLLGGRLLDSRAPRNAAVVLGPLLLAVPFAVGAATNAAGSGALKLVPGWESAPWADGPAAVAFFYATNLGLPLVLAVAALVVRGTPWRAFLAAWALALFLVPNVVQVSVVAFDMNKYFQAMWVALALLAAWLVRRSAWPAVAVVLLVTLPSPLLVSAWTALDREQVLDAAEFRAVQFIVAATPEGSVFVTDGWLNAPTDAAGRLRLLTFTPYIANLGFDPDERAAQIREIYCGGDVERSATLMRALGADYLITGRLPGDCTTPTDFSAFASDLEKVFTADWLVIWRLTDGAAGDR